MLLQGRLAQLQAERDELEDKATTSASRLDTTSQELQQIQAELKSKLEEQQSQFRALEEEQYGDWEKRVGSTLLLVMQMQMQCCMCSTAGVAGFSMDQLDMCAHLSSKLGGSSTGCQTVLEPN